MATFADGLTTGLMRYTSKGSFVGHPQNRKDRMGSGHQQCYEAE